MTRAWLQNAENWKLLEAFRDGEKIEARFTDTPDDDWERIDDPGFWHNCKYRIAPKPKLRPWTLKEVPLGALVRVASSRY